jgi:tetratricopeptide (TPR) repeat protein
VTAASLADAKRLLGLDPAAAAVAARRAVAADPGAIEPRFVLGAALRRSGALDDALALLAPLTEALPRAWGAHYELGMARAGRGRIEAALPALERAAALNPASSLVLHALGDALMLLGRAPEGEELQSRVAVGSVDDPRLAVAVAAWFDRTDAAPLASLGLHLGDIAAVRLIADAGLRAGRVEPVATLLEQALGVTPHYLPARFGLALALYRLERGDDALAAVDAVLTAAPGATAARALRAAIHMQRGDVTAATDDYAAIVGTDANVWHGYGHALRAAGRHDEAVVAYHRALALRPGFAEVYWSLANLKTWRFTADDRAAMAALLDNAADDDRAFLHFALGKADEDLRAVAASFAHYAAGNAARRGTARYDRAGHEDFVARTIATFTADFFAERTGVGDPARDPIFVVGMPRSGSTLVEQILASHPQIDGLSELPDLPAVARRIAGRYPDALAALAPADFTRIGRDYLDQTRPRRRPDRPRFVDKFPGNVLHAGLIHLALPNATIIDVRRDPVATCFSLFKQLFARGQAYSYDLADLGHYYRHYVALIDHFAAVLPGRILTLSYEALVDDAEGTTRRLLDHAGLPFDPACLTFFANTRAVRTASSEQVRQPIYRSGLDGWRAYAAWLRPLIDALGPLAPPLPIAVMPILDDLIR